MTRWSSPPLAGVERWRVIQGETDWMVTPSEVEAFWTGRLPGAGFRVVPGVGRFLVLSHPALVAEALCAAPSSARADVPAPV
jgi:pimeloyl-ACP methyl ester carboxylesterase